MDAADVNETFCENKCGGSDYIENKTRMIDNMSDSDNITGMLDSLNDMCT
jgi:hypothetical protein